MVRIISNTPERPYLRTPNVFNTSDLCADPLQYNQLARHEPLVLEVFQADMLISSLFFHLSRHKCF